jgi:hypothetical protein
MKNVKFTYGSTSGVIGWDGARAEAPILLDGVETGYQTADASHDLETAVGLVLSKAFGEDVDLSDVSIEEDADGYRAGDINPEEPPAGAIAYKYTDPTEGARWVYEESDLAEIQSQDPSLIRRL